MGAPIASASVASCCSHTGAIGNIHRPLHFSRSRFQSLASTSSAFASTHSPCTLSSLPRPAGKHSSIFHHYRPPLVILGPSCRFLASISIGWWCAAAWGVSLCILQQILANTRGERGENKEAREEGGRKGAGEGEEEFGEKRKRGGGGIGKGKKQDDLVFMHFFFEAMRRMQFYVEISFFIFSLGMYEGMNVVIISWWWCCRWSLSWLQARGVW